MSFLTETSGNVTCHGNESSRHASPNQKACAHPESEAGSTNADGAHPSAEVVRDGKGNLFGTTEEGGASDYGTVYKVNTSGQEIVLHSFTDPDGYFPLAGVIRDASGNLYGTTLNGGASGYGSVYEIDSSGQEAVLYSFIGGTDGANPYGG